MKRWPLAVLAVFLAAACGPVTGNTATYALPDRVLTPGAAGADITQICPKVNPALEAARPTTTSKTRVFTAYRIPPAQHHLYVIDHDIPLALDGRNIPANYWPQPVTQAKVKDRVENDLHTAVCAHRVPLASAQAAIAANWSTAEHTLGLAP